MSDPVRNSEREPGAGLNSIDSKFPEIYRELRALARLYLSRKRADYTLQPTALVHEAYLKLLGQRQAEWKNHAHFLAIAAKTMRRVLLDYDEQHRAQKRGGEFMRITLADVVHLTRQPQVDLLDLDEALNKLEQLDPRQARIVELRFFAGLTAEETAEALAISPATVQREWITARLWLIRHLSRPSAS